MGTKVGQLHRRSKWFAPHYVSGQVEQLWSPRLHVALADPDPPRQVSVRDDRSRRALEVW